MKLMTYQRPSLAWPTFGRLASLQEELDRMFESPMTSWAPPLDVYEDKDSFSIRVELPGMKREDIEVTLQDGALVITGERKEEKVQDETTAVAGNQVKAQYKDGILTVTLPKAEEAKPKAITVSE
jgi:HSP20 family protein